MKNFINKYIYKGVMAFALVAGISSCTDYLDKNPDSDVDGDAVFTDFTHFQGFVELNYNCIPNKESNMWCCTFNWGDDEIMNAGLGDGHLTHQMDLGNYRNWYSNNQHFLHADNPDPTSSDKYAHSMEHGTAFVIATSVLRTSTSSRDPKMRRMCSKDSFCSSVHGGIMS